MKVKKAVLVFFPCLLFAVLASGQSKTLTLKIAGRPLNEALSAIEKQGGYYFIYKTNSLDLTSKVTLDVTDAPIGDILERLIGDKASFQIDGKQIVLTGASVQPTGKSQSPVTVSGVVSDVMGPLPGVYVLEKGTQNGTTTGLDGRYVLTVTGDATLVYSTMGYTAVEENVRSRTTIDVALSESSEMLQDAVVVGYGTLEKKQVTSSITSIRADNLVQGASGSTIATALRGQVSGMTINTTSSPNASYSFSLRGVSSINADDSPLIVIDGIPGGHLSALNMDEIESIDVLKDASAGAIYGTRAAGGVILVTTKKASEGSMTVTYSGEMSTEAVRNRPRVLGRERYLHYDLGFDYGSDTDWYGKLIDEWQVSQRHSISAEGGNKYARVFANFMTQDQRGIAIGDGRKDYEGRINANFTALDGLVDIILHSQFLQVDRDIRSNSSNFNQALKLNPTISPYSDVNESGYNVLTGGNDTWNPLADVMLKDISRTEQWISADATVKFNLPYGFSFSTVFGWQNKNRQNYTYYNKYHKNSLDYGYEGSASLGYYKWVDKSLESYLTWIKSYGPHSINAVAGYSFWQEGYEYFSETNYDFVVDGIGGWDIGKGSWLSEGDASMASHKDPRERLIAGFARANYSYDDKYIVMATLRREGSSKFGPMHRYGNFWSLSAGWRISKEPWMGSTKSWLNDLKLRAGYGVTGNNNFSSGIAVPTYGSNSTYPMNGEWIVSYGYTKNVNYDLKWEEKTEFNAGVDYALFSNKLSGKLDVYRRGVNGMLYSIRVAQPPAIYETMTSNVGNLENRGWEFEVTWKPVNTPAVRYSTTARFSHNRSKIKSLWGDNTYSDRVEFPSPGNPGNGGRIEAGTVIGRWYIWRYAGITSDGRWLLYDKDDNIILADDRTYEDKRYLGNAIPKLIVSWDHNFSYKRFSVNVNLRSWLDFDVFNTINMYYGLSTAAGNNTLRTAFIKNRFIKQEKVLCDYWLEDGTFLKIDALSFGYDLPTKERLKYLKGVNFYLTFRDLACFSMYSGLNPETNINGIDAGYEWFNNIYPQTIRISLGAKLTF